MALADPCSRMGNDTSKPSNYQRTATIYGGRSGLVRPLIREKIMFKLKTKAVKVEISLWAVAAILQALIHWFSS